MPLAKNSESATFDMFFLSFLVSVHTVSDDYCRKAVKQKDPTNYL